MRLIRGGRPKARLWSKDLRFKYTCIEGPKKPPLVTNSKLLVGIQSLGCRQRFMARGEDRQTDSAGGAYSTRDISRDADKATL